MTFIEPKTLPLFVCRYVDTLFEDRLEELKTVTALATEYQNNVVTCKAIERRPPKQESHSLLRAPVVFPSSAYCLLSYAVIPSKNLLSCNYQLLALQPVFHLRIAFPSPTPRTSSACYSRMIKTVNISSYSSKMFHSNYRF